MKEKFIKVINTDLGDVKFQGIEEYSDGASKVSKRAIYSSDMGYKSSYQFNSETIDNKDVENTIKNSFNLMVFNSKINLLKSSLFVSISNCMEQIEENKDLLNSYKGNFLKEIYKKLYESKETLYKIEEKK